MRRMHTFNVCLLATTLLSGCVTYSSLSYEQALPDNQKTTVSKVNKVEAYFADDFDSELSKLYERGFELVGYSKFVSALQPPFAKFNATVGAKKRGAPVVMMKQPEKARIGQFGYLMTYWRPAPESTFRFGALYGDSPAQVIASVGCAANTVRLSAVVPDSPADKMGLKKNDIIVSIDGNIIDTSRQLDDLLGLAEGNEISVGYIRDEDLKVANGVVNSKSSSLDEVIELKTGPGIGVLEAKLDDEIGKALGRKKGVFVEGVRFGSPACGAELRLGDLIVSANGKPIKSAKQFSESLKSHHGKHLEIGFIRGGIQGKALLDLTNDAYEITANTYRRDIAEASIATPVWERGKAKDFTWATVTSLVAKGALKGYSNYLQAEQERIAAYNRAQARAASQGHKIRQGTGRRSGSFYVETPGGGEVRINEATAVMLQNNPDYDLLTSRRGVLQVKDNFGKRVVMPSDPFVIKISPVSITAPIDIGAIYQKAAFGQVIYGNVKAMQPRPSTAIRNQPEYGSVRGGGYQTFQSKPYVGGKPGQKTTYYSAKSRPVLGGARRASYQDGTFDYTAFFSSLQDYSNTTVGTSVISIANDPEPSSGTASSTRTPQVLQWPGTDAQMKYQGTVNVETQTLEDIVGKGE